TLGKASLKAGLVTHVDSQVRTLPLGAIGAPELQAHAGIRSEVDAGVVGQGQRGAAAAPEQQRKRQRSQPGSERVRRHQKNLHVTPVLSRMGGPEPPSRAVPS